METINELLKIVRSGLEDKLAGDKDAIDKMFTVLVDALKKYFKSIDIETNDVKISEHIGRGLSAYYDVVLPEDQLLDENVHQLILTIICGVICDVINSLGIFGTTAVIANFLNKHVLSEMPHNEVITFRLSFPSLVCYWVYETDDKTMNKVLITLSEVLVWLAANHVRLNLNGVAEHYLDSVEMLIAYAIYTFTRTNDVGKIDGSMFFGTIPSFNEIVNAFFARFTTSPCDLRNVPPIPDGKRVRVGIYRYHIAKIIQFVIEKSGKLDDGLLKFTQDACMYLV